MEPHIKSWLSVCCYFSVWAITWWKALSPSDSIPLPAANTSGRWPWVALSGFLCYAFVHQAFLRCCSGLKCVCWIWPFRFLTFAQHQFIFLDVQTLDIISNSTEAGLVWQWSLLKNNDPALSMRKDINQDYARSWRNSVMHCNYKTLIVFKAYDFF